MPSEADNGDVTSMFCLAVLLAQRGQTGEAEMWVRRATSLWGRIRDAAPTPACC